MPLHVSPGHKRTRAGFALVLVLGFLVLLTILVVAFYSSVTTDYASTKQYSNGAATKGLADSVVQVVMGQIKAATGGTNVTWASQPGMIRTYDAAGNAAGNYKLYSSGAMTTPGALTAAQVADYDTAWSTKPAAWTDLNAPVTDVHNYVNFPILDGNNLRSLTTDASGNSCPAYYGYDAINNATGAPTPDGLPDVAGFAVDPNAKGITFDPSIAPSATNTAVPIPVTWLYQLRDGTLIAPDATSATTATFSGATKLGAGNPIVARVAFWTDDETSKLNINTACGDEWKPAQISPSAASPAGAAPYTPPGAFWDVPRAYTGFDYNNLALLQPAQHEYQRYPGHPATAYLSAVFPNLARDQIFGLVPRVSGGGSQGGTVAPQGTPTPDADRLYASVDELLFKPTSSNNARDLNDTAKSVLDKPRLERAKFFLTTDSRAPEVNLFNKPRIAVWPIDHDVVAQQSSGGQSPRGTAFDGLIAFCAHLGTLGNGNDYFFQRSANGYLSQTQDYDLVTGANNTQRNHLLYAYLQSMASTNIPGFGGSLGAKFGTDSDQVLTEIFDYIRCVNPSDDNIAFATKDGNGNPTNDLNCYTPNEVYTNTLLAGGYQSGKVFTPQPYHSFIAPTRIGNTQGFGRTITLSEIGLEFICNADGSQGTIDSYLANNQNKPPGAGTPIFYAVESNQPYPSSDARAHGYKRNVDLVQGTPLTATQRRVQGMLLLNPYTVSPGYSTMHMDIGIEVLGLDGITVNGKSIGFPSDKTIVMSNPTYRTPLFGVNAPFFFNSYLAPVRTMIDAPSQKIGDTNTTNPKGYTNTNSRFPPFRTYEFLSSPFTVDTSAGNMALGGGQNVTIKIWHLSPADKSAGVSLTTPSASSTLVQTIAIDFSQLGVSPWQIPTLLAAPVDPYLIHTGGVQPETLWDFSWAGVFGDYSVPGRLFDDVGNPGHPIESVLILNDSARTMVPGYPTGITPGAVAGTPQGVAGDYRMLAAQNAVPSGPGTFVLERLVIDSPNVQFATSFANLFFNGWRVEALVPPNYTGTQKITDLGQGTSSGIGSPYGALITSIPPNAAVASASLNLLPVQTGDYDNGAGSDMDGPYVNKPDTGYEYQLGTSQHTYPYYGNFAENSSASFFSPNRQISSPGMFGSLPVGVKRGFPWQTLLFRPQPTHPDGVSVPDAGTTRASGPPYGGKAADHLIMDWFWMPVVEPYALSEPFSTAGKINMNYQCSPMTYITRATAVDALLKSQRILAIPNTAAMNLSTSSANANWKAPLNYSGPDISSTGNAAPPFTDYRSDLNLSVVNGTLRQFDETFASGDLFRSATQICDIYLTPQGQSWSSNADAENFWKQHQLTGDNSRERPYANLYGCLTTKSNSFTVHFRVQALQKVPGTDPKQWVEGRDKLLSEYRGSSLIERYVDPQDPSLPDFAAPNAAASTLDSFYKFRVVSTKKFAP